MKTLCISLAALPTLALPFSAAAEDAPKDIIVVTATRTDMPLKEAIVPVTVITRDQIEQSQANDLAELLRFEAGIDIGRNGGPGQATSVFLRGTESNHTLVLVDGVRINPGTIGGAAIQNLAPDLIDRIEIVKGARSALFGTDAIGGVVNIITRRSNQSYAEATVGAGSFGTNTGSISGGGRSRNGEFGVSVSWQDTDGFPARTGTAVDRGYDNLSANMYLQRRFGINEVSIRHWQAVGTVEYLDFFLAPLDQDFRNASTAIELITDLNADTRSKLLLSHIIDHISQNQSADFVESSRTTLDWQYSVRAGSHTWIGGLYLADETARTLSFGSGFDQDTSIKAIFVEDLWSSGRHQTFLAARLSDHEGMGSEATWNAEYAFDLSDAWTINAGKGHAFRAPDATDRFGFGGNPGLKPESAHETQLAIRFQPDPGRRMILEFYRTDIDDLIEFDLSAFQLRNISRAEIRGVQLAYHFEGRGFDFGASLVHQEADNVTDGVRLLRRAEDSLTLTVTKDIGRHIIGVSLLASGEREDFLQTVLDDYVLANLTGRFALTRNWALFARIENLTDQSYETAAGFPMQERSAYMELKYAWD